MATIDNSPWVGSGDSRVTGEGQQTAPAVAALAGGGYVIAWLVEGSVNGIDFSGVRAQRFDAGGAKVGGELVLSSGPAAGVPDLAALADGGFVATWDARPDPAGPTSYVARRFDGAGNAVGGEFQPNAAANLHHAASAEATALAGGGYLVEWWADIGAGWGPAVQVYTAGGAPVGGNKALGYEAPGNPYGEGTHIHAGGTAAASDGGFVAVWSASTAYVPGSGSIAHVYAQRFDAAGSAVSGPVEVATSSSASFLVQGVEAAVLAGSGELVVSLRGMLPDGRTQLTAQRFDGAGHATGPVQTMVFADVVIDSKVTALGDGGFVVSWLHGATEQQTLFAQRFDAGGAKLGDAVLIGSGKALYAHYSVTATANGGAVFAWDDGRLDLGDVYAERFAPSASSGGDTAPPGVVGFAPADEAVSVPITTNIQLTFGETVQKGAGSILLKNSAGAVVEAYDVASSGNVTISGNILTIDPTEKLAYSTGYSVEIAAGAVRDLAGNAYAGTTTYNFTTGGPPDGPAPSPEVVGTGGPDNLVGSTGDDRVSGGGGNDTLNGRGGNDAIDGGDGTDTAIIETTMAGVQAYSFANGVITVTTALGTQTLVNVERVRLNDGLFAFDTQGPAGETWQAAAIFHAGFGHVPGAGELSRWTAAADAAPTMGALAQQMIDAYAPGVSSHTLVAHVYTQLVHQAPSGEVVQSYVDQIGPGRQFATQGDLLAYAASLSLNTDGMAGFVGSIQQLEPDWF
ncbi:hypothetical protein RAMLITH_06070 [Ramlibacter sp. RBP-2]|uniref:SbsA Ig-like domain-containing protein n=1 Tax=Ramlibacter lithotrophicus TaxID=2606681 RepID=A0A7X6I5I2_9BURK|nr:Ig-like domain-containing protein [Ramlibacter lithotrophicus]NKE65381.1 hypothetical protein [Ramlibacter lithotrophicus]